MGSQSECISIAHIVGAGRVPYPKAALYAVGKVRKIVKGVPAASKGL